jgi:Resolvase, N terminal domain
VAGGWAPQNYWDQQADNGQHAAITAAAETRGWDIIWVEDAASAKDLDRPGLAYALHLLSTGQAGGEILKAGRPKLLQVVLHPVIVPSSGDACGH